VGNRLLISLPTSRVHSASPILSLFDRSSLSLSLCYLSLSPDFISHSQSVCSLTLSFSISHSLNLVLCISSEEEDKKERRKKREIRKEKEEDRKNNRRDDA
jgi:hypothetical protein